MHFATPEELAQHLAMTIDDEVFIAKAVRIKFPDWGDTPKLRFASKSYANVRKAEHSPDYVARTDPWKPGEGRDIEHEEAMQRGCQMLLDAITKGIPAPSSLTWRAPQQAFKRDDTLIETASARVDLIREREHFTDSLRVSRDACPYCGIRGDIGCKHRRVA